MQPLLSKRSSPLASARSNRTSQGFELNDDEVEHLLLQELDQTREEGNELQRLGVNEEDGDALDEDNPLFTDLDAGSSIWDASFNFTNSIVGAGIIGLPYAFWQAGFVAGVVLLTVLSLAVDWTVLLLVKDAKLAGKATYQGLIQHCYGRQGLILISFAQFIFAYGAMCAYTVILGDTLPLVFSQFISSESPFSFFVSRQAVIVVCTLSVSLPLSLYRDVSALSRTSAVSIVMIVFIVVSVVFAAFSVPAEQRGDQTKQLTVMRSGIFRAIGVISFAFVCHHNTFLIYNSLRVPTMNRFATVTHLSTGASYLLCLAMACGGYLAFIDKSQANILSNFPSNHLVINIARFFFGVNMFLTFPLECFVCREVLFNLWWSDENLSAHLLAERATPMQHILTTLTLVLTSMVIALATCDLGFLLELTGGSSASVLAYIMPAACFLKLSSGPILSTKRIMPLVSIVFGVCVMVLSTFFAISSFLDSNAPHKQC